MKKHDNNPIGNLILKYLKTAEWLYRHLMKGGTKNEDLVAEKITQDINQHFSGRYKIIWNDTLNHFLVDFDIICILKNHIGYKWSHCLGKAVQTILCNASDGARGAQLFVSVPFFIFNWRIIK